MTQQPVTRVAVIGAGAAGLAAARGLQAAGLAVTVFDKARRPGGRLASRRSDWGPFHHGAPALSLPDLALGREVQALLDLAGDALSPVVADNLGGGACAAFSHAPQINALAARWAEGLEVRCQHTLTGWRQEAGGWWLDFSEATAPVGPFSQVVLTAPTAQALTLLEQLPLQTAVHDALSATRHLPCWSLMWVPSEPPADRGFIETPAPDSGLGLIVREDARDGDHGAIRYVVHATAAWSAAHLDADAEWVASQLVAAAAAWLDCPASSDHAVAHRWRFAVVDQAAGQSCLIGREGLYYAGDACLGNTALHALISGAAAARQLLADLGGDLEQAA